MIRNGESTRIRAFLRSTSRASSGRRPVHEWQAFPFLLVRGSVPRYKIDRVIAVPRRTYATLYVYKELVYLAGNGTRGGGTTFPRSGRAL